MHGRRLEKRPASSTYASGGICTPSCAPSFRRFPGPTPAPSARSLSPAIGYLTGRLLWRRSVRPRRAARRGRAQSRLRLDARALLLATSRSIVGLLVRPCFRHGTGSSTPRSLLYGAKTSGLAESAGMATEQQSGRLWSAALRPVSEQGDVEASFANHSSRHLVAANGPLVLSRLGQLGSFWSPHSSRARSEVGAAQHSRTRRSSGASSGGVT